MRTDDAEKGGASPPASGVENSGVTPPASNLTDTDTAYMEAAGWLRKQQLREEEVYQRCVYLLSVMDNPQATQTAWRKSTLLQQWGVPRRHNTGTLMGKDRPLEDIKADFRKAFVREVTRLQSSSTGDVAGDGFLEAAEWLRTHGADENECHQRCMHLLSALESPKTTKAVWHKSSLLQMWGVTVQAKAATLCSGGCNPMQWRLQPYFLEAATVCSGGCNHI